MVGVSPSGVRAIVAAVCPERTIRAVSEIEPGKNAIFAVNFGDGAAVLKVGTASPDRVRAEPAIVRFVRRRTDVPVPRVLGATEAAIDHPACLFERVPGRTVPDRPDDLPVSELGRICTDAGRNLAALHAVDEFAAVGPLVPDGDGVAVAAAGHDWPGLFRRGMAAKLEALDDRFDRYQDALRDYVDTTAAAAAESAGVDPVLVHMDYRPANLVLDDGERGRTRAVLDWAGAAAAPAAYELAHAEALLTDWPRLDEADRARLTARLRKSYASRRRWPEIPTVYRVDARLRLMKHLDLEVGDRDEATVTDRVHEHVAALERLGVL